MPENDRGIGSEGLEQGGPQLGNDYTRRDLSVGNAGDALTSPDTQGLSDKDDDQDSLSMDNESSRNLGGDAADEEDDIDDLELDEDELDDDDDDLADLDDDDDDDEEDGSDKIL